VAVLAIQLAFLAIGDRLAIQLTIFLQVWVDCNLACIFVPVFAGLKLPAAQACKFGFLF